MRKLIKCFCLLLLLIGVVQLDAREDKLAPKDYSKMSTAELDAAFVSAVQGRRSEEVQELIQSGADVNTPIPYIWTQGDCDWDIKSTALVYAVRYDCASLVKVLIKVDRELDEALDIAISLGSSAAAEVLINGGADINYVNKFGDTPLISACITGYTRRSIIKKLLEAGADVAYADKNGKTALMLVVDKHDLVTVQYLLAVPKIHKGSFFGFGTKPINYFDKDGNTALMLAIKRVRYTYINNQEYQICLDSQNIINELINTPGIDLYHVNKDGETAITLLEKLNEKMSRSPY